MNADFAIDRVEVITIGPPVERLTWAQDQDGQYMTGILVRVTTAGGLEGLAAAASYSAHGWDLSVAETLRLMIRDLIGLDAREREKIWLAMQSRTLPRAPQAQSLIDVALWDIAGKAAGQPLYKLLGGARESIAAYASTPLLASPQAYVDFVAALRERGFGAIKFHCWCEPTQDLAMVEAVQRAHGGKGLALMLDVEQRYDFDQARRVGHVLGDYDYAWFEAPMDDYDLEAYRRLTAQLRVPVIPAGNSIIDHRLVAFALTRGCWDKVRIDVMVSGGITGALKIVHLAQCHGVSVELQCWGYALHQAANLHLMLAQPNCGYFEYPTHSEIFDYGVAQGIRLRPDGHVAAPPGAGLGIELDMPAIERAAIGRIEQTAQGAREQAGSRA
jgi:L-alanine-DL-glutamate epimerase-like enolase superfamily enzyme